MQMKSFTVSPGDRVVALRTFSPKCIKGQIYTVDGTSSDGLIAYFKEIPFDTWYMVNSDFKIVIVDDLDNWE